jgi:hypothetical protein
MTLLLIGNVFAQDLAFDSSVSAARANLDLNAVAELFKDSENIGEENLGEFEKKKWRLFISRLGKVLKDFG